MPDEKVIEQINAATRGKRGRRWVFWVLVGVLALSLLGAVVLGAEGWRQHGMNAAVGDIFNDGRLAIYKTNISEPGQLLQGNDLWVPKPDRPAAFENLASALAVDLGGWSWGAQFGDLNNDGTQDIYLTNGYVSAGERSSYWYDFGVIATGHSTIIADAKNWPPMRGRSLSG